MFWVQCVCRVNIFGVKTLVNKHFWSVEILGRSQLMGFVVVLGGFEVFCIAPGGSLLFIFF